MRHRVVSFPLPNRPGTISLCTSYTIFVNRKYQRSGHLFQGRYKAFIVEKGGDIYWNWGDIFI